MDPLGAGAALHRLAPPGHISSTYRAGKDGARVGKNVTAHQEKKETSKRRTGEKRKRKQGTKFKKAVCCPFAVVQGHHSKKNEGEFPG